MALIRKLRGRDMSPSKEPEVEEEEKTTPKDSPLLLALQSYPDFEDSENRIVLITPGSQKSLPAGSARDTRGRYSMTMDT